MHFTFKMWPYILHLITTAKALLIPGLTAEFLTCEAAVGRCSSSLSPIVVKKLTADLNDSIDGLGSLMSRTKTPLYWLDS